MTIAATSSPSSVNPLTGLASGSAASNAAGSASAFLQLLVTQMQNQDPLNPMDNAQMTSQIAQINTVNGINQLNTSVTGLNSQMTQMQALQGAALVGHQVTVDGNGLVIKGGSGSGGYSLPGAATDVQVQIVDGNGNVAGTLDLGAQGAGNHSFTWPASGVADGAAYTFKVGAVSGSSALAATPLMQANVVSVSTGSGGLQLQTSNAGNVAFSNVVAFN
ncbi:MAG: flagellar hook assembly protein FlgD [Burkholderiales bacterium]|nr:flagellar hook assembly protein FlgD [Burkholderiales bacterium]MDE1929467.1 flagellar hook assembly protein FlgD [Burkholderiales bacterium]MDE2504617.1 flagellar hook assembly protein FlgD [Burkholderiales bacterium]